MEIASKLSDMGYVYILQPINKLDFTYKGQQSISVLEPYQNS